MTTLFLESDQTNYDFPSAVIGKYEQNVRGVRVRVYKFFMKSVVETYATLQKMICSTQGRNVKLSLAFSKNAANNSVTLGIYVTRTVCRYIIQL